jgi:hypothetical protein
MLRNQSVNEPSGCLKLTFFNFSSKTCIIDYFESVLQRVAVQDCNTCYMPQFLERGKDYRCGNRSPHSLPSNETGQHFVENYVFL